MATFDQLPADQRAIIELVLKRGRSYSQLSDLLGMPETRVRELAREALVSLAPVTAKRVEDEWRNQIADYTLGQQSNAESVATQNHLRRSETARAWLGSLLDSLEQLYGDDALPDLPESDGTAERPARARDRARGERPAREGRGAGAAAAAAGSDKDGEAFDADDARAGGDRDERVVRNERRMIFGGVVLVVLVAILILLLTGVLGGGDDDGGGGDGGSDTAANNNTTTGQNGDNANADTQIVGEMALKAVDPDAPEDVVGIAQIAKSGNQTQVGIRAKLPQVASRHAYEVWLFNSKRDAVSLGAARTDAQGNFEGAAPLPEGYEKYKYIDISDEPVNRDTDHSGKSVLRGAFADLVTPEQQQQAQQGQGQTTP